MKSTTPVTIAAVVLVAGVFLWYVFGGSQGEEIRPETAGPTTRRAERKAKDKPAKTIPKSLDKARDLAMKEVYADHRFTFFCDCSFDESGLLDLSACGYRPREKQQADKADKVWWRTIVPTGRFGRDRRCWKKGDPRCVDARGNRYKRRKCCAKEGVDKVFRRMRADLHNIVPVIRELHAARFNTEFGDVEGERREYGQCDFEVSEKVFEPPELKHGEIARAYLYMADVYGMELSADERALFMQWHRDNPPTAWERKRNRRIKKIQRIGNPFVEGKE